MVFNQHRDYQQQNNDNFYLVANSNALRAISETDLVLVIRKPLIVWFVVVDYYWF